MWTWRWLSVSQGAYPSLSLLWITPWSWTPSLQKSETTHFSYPNHQLVVFCYNSHRKLIQLYPWAVQSFLSSDPNRCPAGDFIQSSPSCAPRMSWPEGVKPMPLLLSRSPQGSGRERLHLKPMSHRPPCLSYFHFLTRSPRACFTRSL